MGGFDDLRKIGSYAKEPKLADEIRNTPPPSKQGLTVQVSVTHTDLFKDILDLVGDVYRESTTDVQEHITSELDRIIGTTHDVVRLVDGRYRHSVSVDVKRCQRCSQDHTKLRFSPLTNPADKYGYWAVCPVTKEPVLLHIETGVI